MAAQLCHASNDNRVSRRLQIYKDVIDTKNIQVSSFVTNMAVQIGDMIFTDGKVDIVNAVEFVESQIYRCAVSLGEDWLSDTVNRSQSKWLFDYAPKLDYFNSCAPCLPKEPYDKKAIVRKLESYFELFRHEYPVSLSSDIARKANGGRYPMVLPSLKKIHLMNSTYEDFCEWFADLYYFDDRPWSPRHAYKSVASS